MCQLIRSTVDTSSHRADSQRFNTDGSECRDGHNCDGTQQHLESVKNACRAACLSKGFLRAVFALASVVGEERFDITCGGRSVKTEISV